MLAGKHGKVFVFFLFLLLTLAQARLNAQTTDAKIHVVLWFDTEDYILPPSDDAALRVAEFLTSENIRATFKVVGEKARTLQRRGRKDVIAALAKHEIGYHSNYHSTQPSPAMYLSDLGWDEGVSEFNRRERKGFDDVASIFGQKPTCYGQPGSSWGPQVFGAMDAWGVKIYLDAGSHVALDGKPHYYGGALTLYKLSHVLRTGLTGEKDLRMAVDRFGESRQQLLAEGGGIVSIYYHPCEFVHEQFWDAVNFKAGANPPREKWKLPPTKTPEASAIAWKTFEDYIRFIRGLADVDFITASQAAELYRDRARGRQFTPDDLKSVAQEAGSEALSFQRHKGYTLAASEAFLLLNEYVRSRGKGDKVESVVLDQTPFGPTGAGQKSNGSVTTNWSQFHRTSADVADFVAHQRRIPTGIWLGSVEVSPESYLRALSRISLELLNGNPPPDIIELAPARLAAADYVSADDHKLWGWIIFPQGFRAPAMMELAKRQAWTLKPAELADTTHAQQ